MTKSRIAPAAAGVESSLRAHEFDKLCQDFYGFRRHYEPVYRQLHLKRKPRIFEFVRGLRLSSQLIYAIRKRLDGSSMTASWGQIMDEDGYISPECDVIIHLRDGKHEEWNGEGRHDKIMEYKFIQRSSAAAVVSCKSLLQGPSKVDRAYATRIGEHVQQLWLFAECCPPGRAADIARAAKDAGYNGFWYFYEYSSQNSTYTANADGWARFLDRVGELRNWRPPTQAHGKRRA